MDVKVKVVAYSFPAICLVLGYVLVFLGDTGSSSGMMGWGAGLIIVGVFLYIAEIVIIKLDKEIDRTK
jgi:hypothetical protein